MVLMPVTLKVYTSIVSISRRGGEEEIIFPGGKVLPDGRYLPDHESSCELSSELSSKNHGNKERNSRISLALLLHNTVVESKNCY